MAPEADWSPDDFINAFADVNILQVEAVGKVIGRTIGVLYQGMIDAGMPQEVATKVIRDVWAETIKTIMITAKES